MTKLTLSNATETGHIKVGKGLNQGTLGVVGSTAIGLASTAPLYSLAATLGYVILAVGAQAPLVFIVACIPMVFAAFAYQELNREMPDCGTTFVWGTKAFGPITGWIGGWAVAVASIMVHSTNGEAPEPEGPEEEYPGGDAKPLEPPHAGQPYPGGDAKPIHNTQK